MRSATGAGLPLATLMLALGLLATPAGAEETGLEALRSAASLTPHPAVTVATAEAAGRSAVEVKVHSGSHGLEIEGRSRIRASRATAWSVLTDYDAIDNFVSSMKESRISGHGDGYVVVDQVAVGGVFPFRRRMRTTLQVREEAQERIRFEDVLHRDFASYRGEWRIEDRGSQVEVVYQVAARPAFGIPDFVARGLFKSRVRELLSEVADEIARRESLVRR